MKTKSIIILLFTITMAAGMVSCDWLKESPESSLTDMQVGDSDEAAASWVTGVYSKWIYDMFCWGYFPRVLEFDADYISGPDWLFGTFGAGNFQGESDVTDALWKGCYGLIARANNAERRIRAMQNISDDVKNNAIGEVKFQKAFAYFLLVRAYGAIPIQSESETAEQSQPRQAVDSVYHYITAQLVQAVDMLYKNTDAAYQSGHISAGSAAGLLAKVYATQAAAAMPTGTEIVVRTGNTYDILSNDKKHYAPLQSKTLLKQAVSGYEQMDALALYEQAALWAKRVIDGEYGQHALLAYDELWKKVNSNASEFLFSVGTVNGDATYKTSVHTHYSGYFTAAGSDFRQSGGWIGCTRHWYDLFDHDDYRITKGVRHRWRYYFQEQTNSGFYYPQDNEYTIMATGSDLNGKYVAAPTGVFADGVSYYYSQDAQCLAFTTKYDDVTNNAIENADANWPFLRYADVMLIYAEAQNELGNLDEACLYLNSIRRRSNALMASTSGVGSLDSKTKMRSAIIEERAKEFACEADRRWDLIRWGIYLDAMNAIGGSDDAGVSKVRYERNLLFPLPVQEINTNKYINENNPGWN